MTTLRYRAKAAVLAVRDPDAQRPYAALPPEAAFRIAYNVVLGREPDSWGVHTLLPQLRSGALTNAQLVEFLTGSEEYHCRARFSLLGPSLHLSRCEFIRSLPVARCILDLGGTHLGDDRGALVAMGYPYPFDEVVVVDLPIDERHPPLYQAGNRLGSVPTALGTVRYAYHSMVDLARYPDGSFDLVYSGQSIEHISEADGDHVLAECLRVLTPGGHLAVDTPNGRATRMQQADFIDPDHEVEYTHAQFVAKLARAGFELVSAQGLNHLGTGAAADKFSETDTARGQGSYAAIEDCYLLAYVARKPG